MKIQEALRKSDRIKREHWGKFHIIKTWSNQFLGSNDKLFNLKPKAILATDWIPYVPIQKINLIQITAVQCCKCLKVIGMDYNNRKRIKDVWCMECSIENNRNAYMFA
jgi:hypothetical protein